MLKTSMSALLCLVLAAGAVQASEPSQSSRADEPVSQLAAVSAVEVVDINTADLAAIEAGLIGIGRVKAQAIIDYRQAHGPFASVDELLEVKGIGAVTLEKNRDRLSAN